MIIVIICFLVIMAYFSGQYLLFKADNKWSWNVIISFKKRKVIFIYLSFIIYTVFILAVNVLTNTQQIELLFFIFVLHIIAAIDYSQKKIPNELVIFLVGMRLIFLIFALIYNKNLAIYTLSVSGFGLILGGIILSVAKMISKNGLGFGDVKLFMAIGFWVGYVDIIEVILLTFLLAMFGAGLLLLTKKVKINDSLPLAPFILLGTIIKKLYDILIIL